MPFDGRDVENDPGAMGELKALGIRNVPVTTVGEKVVVGFDREELTRLFGLSEKSERRAAD
ncbi:MAG: glutaredoxin, partial [Deltaproteobacteria bacterium]